MVSLTISTIDKQVTFEVVKVTIFTTHYIKKIGGNEFHNPTACKLVVETKTSLLRFIFLKPLIISRKKSTVEVTTISEFKQVTGQKPYFGSEEAKKLRAIANFYNASGNKFFSANELINQNQSLDFRELERVQNIKIPPSIGGDFGA